MSKVDYILRRAQIRMPRTHFPSYNIPTRHISSSPCMFSPNVAKYENSGRPLTLAMWTWGSRKNRREPAAVCASYVRSNLTGALRWTGSCRRRRYQWVLMVQCLLAADVKREKMNVVLWYRIWSLDFALAWFGSLTSEDRVQQAFGAKMSRHFVYFRSYHGPGGAGAVRQDFQAKEN